MQHYTRYTSLTDRFCRSRTTATVNEQRVQRDGAEMVMVHYNDTVLYAYAWIGSN